MISDNDCTLNLEKNLNEMTTPYDMSLTGIINGISTGISTAKDTYNAGKVVDYYQMAKRADSIYNDKKLYNHLKKESQIAYDSITNNKIKTFVKAQVTTFVK